jgi:hypothetical protein
MINPRHDGIGRAVKLEADIGIADFLEKYGFTHDLAQVTMFHDGLGHAGKCGKLIDHAAYVSDLTDDCIGALIEYAAIIFGDARGS